MSHIIIFYIDLNKNMKNKIEYRTRRIYTTHINYWVVGSGEEG